MRERTLLVLARKFNDIFYSISTPEWKIFNRHVLVIFANDIFEKYIPFRELFDDIIVFDSPKRRINGINVIREIRARKDALECEAVILSNIVLVANQYLINISRCRYIFLLEDGLMNYSDFRPSDSRMKSVVQWVLGINQRKLIERIYRTYLLIPDMARFYGGVRAILKPMTIQPIGENILSKIEGKKIFVGQCLYRFGYISIGEYNELVNRIIKKYDIDCYLPHAFALDEERIDCPILDLGQLGITLEFLAPKTSFTLYSFFSSVLYTTRVINPDIRTYQIHIPELSMVYGIPILKEYCSGIIDPNL